MIATGLRKKRLNQRGFTSVELLVASVIFPIFVIGITQSFNAVRRSYTVARQYNEVYAVLSACPEIDRALEYSSLTGSSNCFPNNTFTSEGSGSTTITYNPTLSVQTTSSLASSDALSTVPDSKVVSIDVAFPNTAAPNLSLRLLITRNGLGQL